MRVLVVDDSVSIQSLMRHVLSRDPRLEVVATARDAYEARELIKRHDPDVLTLDVEMPGMNGLEFLERLMRLRPMPVVMVSSATQRGSDAAIQALSLGAIDCIPKPSAGLTEADVAEIADRIAVAARGRPRARDLSISPWAAIPHGQRTARAVLIGASTGGVAAIETVLSGMPPDCPPIILAQHMPQGFLISFAKRLDDRFPQVVALASDGAELRPGHVFLAPGGARHTGIGEVGGTMVCTEVSAPPRNGHCPSVDVLFETAIDMADRITAVLLTGLGQDGAGAMKRLYERGAYCIGQDEASSVVYGMPRAAAEVGALSVQLPLSDIAVAICRRRSPRQGRQP
ncbi:chemotaxis response regulator protein-glutamate methylesterase [Pseudooceanicola nanhaiensis]|uniref:protein-glutamate methylesterase/protein-glutamine glutaminase n=1 Tax=Pseudooceanicola nanhaiensis TaxID=375761 RepID=UPI00296F1660|nr:chemotaxis response regulator protein-glutamate methylesterase [Pseudooceanicola nanhaiensis]